MDDRAPKTAGEINEALMTISWRDPIHAYIRDQIAALVLRWLAAERAHALRDVTEEEWRDWLRVSRPFQDRINALLASRSQPQEPQMTETKTEPMPKLTHAVAVESIHEHIALIEGPNWEMGNLHTKYLHPLPVHSAEVAAVVEAARTWRAKYNRAPSEYFHEHTRDLMSALDALERSLAPAPPVDPVVKDCVGESGWVIERHAHGRLHYWCAGPNSRSNVENFTYEHADACRFAREADATLVLYRLCDGLGRVAHHSWGLK